MQTSPSLGNTQFQGITPQKAMQMYTRNPVQQVLLSLAAKQAGKTQLSAHGCHADDCVGCACP